MHITAGLRVGGGFPPFKKGVRLPPTSPRLTGGCEITCIHKIPVRECGVGRCFVGVASCDMSFPCMLSDIPTRDLQLVYIYVLGFILNTSLGFSPPTSR